MAELANFHVVWFPR